MERDFTLSKYRELLQSLPKGNYTLQGALENKDQFGIIRHDVDRPPKNVLRLAQMENDLGIKTTYYFRVKKKLFKPEVISHVKNMGHEIGYHYEVLDKAKGDKEKAIDIFQQEWKLFKEWDATTICMHGNPLSKYVNRDIWKDFDYSNFGVKGEGYLSVDFSKYVYFTDTSRKWNFKGLAVKDRISQNLTMVRSTDDIISKVKQEEIKNIYILTHPSRWNDDWVPWARELSLQSLKNIVKYQISVFRNGRS